MSHISVQLVDVGDATQSQTSRSTTTTKGIIFVQTRH